ncbi:MAG: glycosyltransferase family 2 protein [Microgenomates group bacterium]
MISAVVLTKNEEKNIAPCLKSLWWCDEIIVIDDYSENETIPRIKNLKLKIYKRHLGGDFAKQRNFGLKKAQGEWVLFVDADERVTPALAAEIKKKILKTPYQGFYLKRQDFWGGKLLQYGETANIKLLRLGKKSAGWWERPVHEVWKIKGRIGELKNPLLHYPHQTVSDFLKDINFYTDLNAKFFYQKGVKTSCWQILAYPAGKFIVNYFLKRGFLDGTAGFIFALFMSFHSFLTRAKLWLLGQNSYQRK